MSSSSFSRLILLALVAPALGGVNMDQVNSVTMSQMQQLGEPMCCDTDHQCTMSHCSFDDLQMTQIPGPLVTFILSCPSGMMSGWCSEMEDDRGLQNGSSGGNSGAGVSGDPHFQTWSSEWFDFHGECDMVLISAPSFHDSLGLQVQIRSKIRYGYSFIETAAVKIGDEVLMVSSFGEYSFGGVSAALPETMAGFPVTYEQVNELQSVFRIQLGDAEELVIRTFKDMVNVNLKATSIKDYGDSVGLMGSFGKGAKLARDGSTLLDDSNAFGMEWQVRPEEDGSLFGQERYPQYPVQCVMPDPTQASRRLRGGAISEKQAEVACEHIASVDARERCVFDVLATQDLDIAAAGVF